MFAKFHLKNIPLYKYETYFEVGKNSFNKFNTEIMNTLESMVKQQEVFDGDFIKTSWFNTTKRFDVFLSHAHEDSQLAISFAGFLYEELGLTAFIDSQIWGNYLKLYSIFERKYKFNDEIKKIACFNHINSMLSVALIEMMDNTESVIFMNTPRSVILYEEMEKSREQGILIQSSWIYKEISMASFLRQKTLEEHRVGKGYWSGEKVSNAFKSINDKKFKFVYDVAEKLKDFREITAADFDVVVKKREKMHSEALNKINALDYLYHDVGMRMSPTKQKEHSRGMSL